MTFLDRWLGLGGVALLIGCSEVRVVDDDGDGSAGGGGAVTGGGSGGGPIAEPQNARLFAAGWLGDGEATGLQIWNDPEETGIDREADVTIALTSPQALAVAGDRLFVCADGDLRIYDDVWGLDGDAEPTVVLEIHGYTENGHHMRLIPELDALWIDRLVYTGASSLSTGAVPAGVTWHDPVYDAARDRLFVVADHSLQVVENASQRTSFEPDWTLFDDDYGVHRLATDGVQLFASRAGSGGSFTSWKVLTWPLALEADTPAADLDAGPPGEILTLAPIPGGGVIAGADHSIWAWAGASASVQDASGWILTPEDTWSAVAVSEAGRVYAAGNELSVFASPALSESIAQQVGGDAGLALIER